MLNIKTAKEYKELKRDFQLMPMSCRPVPFYHMDGRFAENGKLTEDVAKNIALYKKSGYGGLTPLPVSAIGGHEGTLPEFGTEEYYDDYEEYKESQAEEAAYAEYADGAEYAEDTEYAEDAAYADDVDGAEYQETSDDMEEE